MVKLYDLTTLCEDKERANAEKGESDGEKSEKSESHQNPFTVPVGMLLYTVARNMRYSYETNVSAKKAGSIKMLLDNCIRLLEKEKHPQIITSSHYMLSDLHLPATTDPSTGIPDFDSDNSDDNSVFDESSLNQSPTETDSEDKELVHDYSPAMQSLRETLKEYTGNQNRYYDKPAPPLTGTLEERCEIALKHIIQGLGCLQFFKNESTTNEEKKLDSEKEKILHEEQNPNMAKPFNPIPLPYEPLSQPKEAKIVDPTEIIPMPWTPKECDAKSNKKSKKKQKKQIKHSENVKMLPDKAVDEYKLDSKSLILHKTDGVIKNWSVHLKILLFEKTCLVYATMAESEYSKENFGQALKNIYLALKCQQLVTRYVTLVKSQNSCLLGRAGDCYFNMCKDIGNIANHQKDFEKENENEIDKQILEEMSKDISEDESCVQEIVKPSSVIEELFEYSCVCYEKALKCSTKDSQRELKRRLGNVSIYLQNISVFFTNFS